MPKVIIDQTKHYREAIVTFDYKEVERILAEIAFKQLGFEGNFKTIIEDQTEGSPSYKIGSKAKVTVTKILEGRVK